MGTRNNHEKRDDVLSHLSEIEYRTLACSSAAEARMAERHLKRAGRKYRFGT
jgi:hypothetical protein